MSNFEGPCGELKPKKETIDDKLKQPPLEQWLPFVGLYFIFRDHNNNKPSLMDGLFENPIRYFGSTSYHAFVVVYSVASILERVL